ncbi:hypothetical protein GZ77_16465 [Endozoicomonas montiporae]|uniref:Phage tail collar domain-containing protein n=2 Tax=Endozoicomonas montiporae TaxID=1027273 RepID=A0A081N5Y3_9GAMM|nr:tail fiber protein [Endozoicomonas montiporae]AMO57235.1 phenylacrylic acid decarboxylase [Endozoicomonas montiporae CL-33]KEQ13856.1 hypothetical protein GZ77_16465 [Endozoicomonas montiporae]
MEFMIGAVMNFGGNYAPRDWTFCHGQLIAIADNQTLYSILGTMWGGDGRNNFAVPDFRSRAPVGSGKGPGLTFFVTGERAGQELHQLTIAQMPVHTHTATFTGTGGTAGDPITATATVNAFDGKGDSDIPHNGYWANASLGRDLTTGGYSSTANTTMATGAIDIAIEGGGGGITGGTVDVVANGGSQAFSIMQPILAINYILCTDGIYPSRN